MTNLRIRWTNQQSHSRSTCVIWSPVIWDGRVVTHLGTGVGQRRTPFWSNTAYLTGLGSGRVQCTAGAALTMTAPWQVYSRRVCLMCARPQFILYTVFPPFSISHAPSLPRHSLPINFHPSITPPAFSFLLSLPALNILIFSPFTPVSLPMSPQPITWYPFACLYIWPHSPAVPSSFHNVITGFLPFVIYLFTSSPIFSPLHGLFSSSFPLQVLYFLPSLKQFITYCSVKAHILMLFIIHSQQKRLFPVSPFQPKQHHFVVKRLKERHTIGCHQNPTEKWKHCKCNYQRSAASHNKDVPLFPPPLRQSATPPQSPPQVAGPGHSTNYTHKYTVCVRAPNESFAGSSTSGQPSIEEETGCVCGRTCLRDWIIVYLFT